MSFELNHTHLTCAVLEGIDREVVLHVDTVNFVSFLTLFRVAALFPGEGRHVYVLFDGRGNGHQVAGAGFATPTPATIRRSLVAQHKEIVVEPVGSVEADQGSQTLLLVGVDCHEEKTVVHDRLCGTRFSFQI
jgi:hypothetical protein